VDTRSRDELASDSWEALGQAIAKEELAVVAAQEEGEAVQEEGEAVQEEGEAVQVRGRRLVSPRLFLAC
jgi:hypothetical protein